MSDTDPGRAAPVGLPQRPNIRRAFDAYVYGRSRNVPPQEKEAAVSREQAARGPWTVAPSPDPVPPATVPVPERHELRYDRNAGTWRDGTSRDGGG